MIIDINNVLLFIEPRNNKSKEPVIDEYTIKMFNLLKININNVGTVGCSGKFITDIGTMGHHTCICGATSTGYDYLLNGKIATNYLCVHYLAYHRNEISNEELTKIDSLNGDCILLQGDKTIFSTLLK